MTANSSKKFVENSHLSLLQGQVEAYQGKEMDDDTKELIGGGKANLLWDLKELLHSYSSNNDMVKKQIRLYRGLNMNRLVKSLPICNIFVDFK